MKRFFPLVPRPGAEPWSNKQQKSDSTAKAAAATAATAAAGSDRDPGVIATWNAQGLLNRFKRKDDDLQHIQRFVETHQPDVFALQEVWLPAASPSSRGDIKSETKAQRQDLSLLHSVLRAQPFDAYHAYWSLADTKRQGVGLLIRKSLGSSPRSVWYSIAEDGTFSKRHVHDGRMIAVEFKTFILLATYVPNNGWTEASFARRREWDSRLQKAVEMRAQNKDAKPIIWTGDLNVCATEQDVSSAEFFRAATSGLKGEPVPDDPGDRGQPGFTINETLRFQEILAKGKLVDVWRKHHGNKRAYTWCGHPGVVTVGKYFKRGMRLDYFLVSERLEEEDEDGERIEACVIPAAEELTMEEFYRRDKRGFLGSDHCPVVLKMRPATERVRNENETHMNKSRE